MDREREILEERNDVQELRNTFNSRGWQLIEEEIHREIEAVKGEIMIFGLKYESVLYKQGQHNVLERMLQLKETLLDEEEIEQQKAADDAKTP